MSDLLSSLKANSMLLANASSNIANLNTPNYKSITTTITSDTAGAPEAATFRTTTHGALIDRNTCSSNVELPQEFCDMMRAQRGYESALCAISTREDMFNDLMAVLTEPE